MKIAVKDIEANPFRHIERYPIDQGKIEQLKRSINTTGFWDNVVVRKHPEKKGRFQLGYGHHRLHALRELNINEVDVPVRDLDDATMLKMMAEENLQYQVSTAVINETVLATKEFLENEIAKYQDYQEFVLLKNNKVICPTQKVFLIAKKQGVGENVIAAFLGENWKPWLIHNAMETLKLSDAGKVDREAAEVFVSPGQSRRFVQAIKAMQADGEKIPASEQRKAAKRVAKDIEDRTNKGAVIEISVQDALNRKMPVKAKKAPMMLDEYVEVTCDRIMDVRLRLERITGTVMNMQSEATVHALVTELGCLIDAATVLAKECNDAQE